MTLFANTLSVFGLFAHVIKVPQLYLQPFLDIEDVIVIFYILKFLKNYLFETKKKISSFLIQNYHSVFKITHLSLTHRHLAKFTTV